MNRAGMIITQGHSLRRELRNFKQVTSSSMASPAIAASWIKQVDSSLSKNQALIQVTTIIAINIQ